MLLRLWVVDPSGIASSICCEFDYPDHAEDIVRIIAVLSGPLEDVLQTWKPSIHPWIHDHTQIRIL
jgi:hypothetical protein